MSRAGTARAMVIRAMGWSWGADVWVALALGAALIFLASVFLYSQSLRPAVSGNGRALPGRFWQLPLVGETFQLLNCAHPDDFLLPRIRRYGPVFQTHLFGHPTVCITEANGVKFVLQSPKLFKTAYNRGPIKHLLGAGGTVQTEGQTHEQFRRLVLAPLTPESLKRSTARIDMAAQECLRSRAPSASDLDSSVVINTFQLAKEFTFEVALHFICDSLTDAAVRKKLRASFSALEKGVSTTFPVNLPGTAYKRALQGRQEAVSVLSDVIENRRAEKGSAQHEDLVGSFLEAKDLDNRQIIDNLVFVLFAGYHTTATAICWVLNNLCLYPDILKEVKAENDAVSKRRASGDDRVTWDDVQQLPLTRRVIDETLRLTNILPFVLRVATEDVSYNGMLIPKGWAVMPWFRSYHLDSKFFQDPYRFDPDRFKTSPKANTYTPFGNGYRICPGSELAKLDVLVFLHRFIQSYEFKASIALEAKPRRVNWMLPRPPQGLPLSIRKRAE